MILTTLAVGTITAGKIITYGCLLGVGFWASKKITGLIDEQLLLHDRKFLQSLTKGEAS